MNQLCQRSSFLLTPTADDALWPAGGPSAVDAATSRTMGHQPSFVEPSHRPISGALVPHVVSSLSGTLPTARGHQVGQRSASSRQVLRHADASAVAGRADDAGRFTSRLEAPSDLARRERDHARLVDDLRSEQRRHGRRREVGGRGRLVFLRWMTAVADSSGLSATSVQRKAAHSETRSRPSRMTSTMATSSAALCSASASDSTPRPRGRGRCPAIATRSRASARTPVAWFGSSPLRPRFAASAPMAMRTEGGTHLATSA